MLPRLKVKVDKRNHVIAFHLFVFIDQNFLLLYVFINKFFAQLNEIENMTKKLLYDEFTVYYGPDRVLLCDE